MSKKILILIISLSVAIVACVGVSVWALFFREDDKPATSDYPPQGTEANQSPIEGDDSTKLESPVGGGAINVTFGTTATVSLADEKVTLYYANPGASNQNVAILIRIYNESGEELIVAKSNLIYPGNEVRELPLEPHAKAMLQAGIYNAELLVRAYNPADGEKAMVDTKGEVTLTVR